MELDRELQNKILSYLADVFPDQTTPEHFKAVQGMAPERRLIANLLYLEEHRLITSGLMCSLDGKFNISSSQLRITKDGLDFIAADGGLNAILRTLVVKVHLDSLAQFERLLLQSSLSQQDKKKYVDQLKELPADATKHLVLRMLDLAMENAPRALQLLQTSLGAGS